MTAETPALLNLLPPLVFLIAMLLLVRMMRARYKKTDQLNREIIELNRNMSETLVEIRNLLAARKS